MNNRVYKFRAWDVNAKIMKDDGTHPEGKPNMKYDVGVLCSYAKNEWATGVDGLEIRPDSKDFVLMQFTGLQDKHGKDIYEADVIWRTQTAKDKAFAWYVVTWWPTLAAFGTEPANKNTEHAVTYRGDLTSPDQFEVIGNIYEHPHLLSGDVVTK